MIKTRLTAMQKLRAITAMALTLCAAGMVQAQTVYRCNDSYSDKPCPGAATVDVNDKRSAAQKQEADKSTRHDQQAAQKLEKERLQQEAANHRNTAAVTPVAPGQAASKDSKKIHKVRSYKAATPTPEPKPAKKSGHSTEAVPSSPTGK